MPYRARGVNVQVKKNGRWVLYDKASTPAKAKSQATALNINVAKKEKGKKKK